MNCGYCCVCKHNCSSHNDAANKRAWRWSRERFAKETFFSRRWRFPETGILINCHVNGGHINRRLNRSYLLVANAGVCCFEATRKGRSKGRPEGNPPKGTRPLFFDIAMSVKLRTKRRIARRPANCVFICPIEGTSGCETASIC